MTESRALMRAGGHELCAQLSALYFPSTFNPVFMRAVTDWLNDNLLLKMAEGKR
jgi:hypothetical protein